MQMISLEKKPNGWIFIDKPLGITSAHVVRRVQKLLPKKTKIGHAGTLDPLASGLLILAIGEATKAIQFAMGKSKKYEFEVTWGQQRSTDDAEGEVVQSSPIRPTSVEIEAILPQFTGVIQQVPPGFSAIKVEGKRAYALARAGEAVELKAREVEVFSLECANTGMREDANNTDFASSNFHLHCSKGTYVRSIARDMGIALGCFGYVSALRRTKIGKISVQHAISLENLENVVHESGLNWLHPVESMLDDIPACEVTQAQAAKLKSGQFIPCMQEYPQAIAMLHGVAIAICVCENSVMKPVRVFN